MAAVELELIAAMLHVGDLSLIHKGLFRAEHCLTVEGKAIHYFLSTYGQVTGGAGHVPTRNVVLQRFDNMELPEAPRSTDFGSLMHEVRVETTRADLREYAMELAQLAEAVDPLGELALARDRLDVIMSEVSEQEDYGFDTHLDLILEHYANKMILPQGIPWPWESMTEATQGMQKGDFIIISGRPKTRKTFVALAVAVHAFVEFGSRVVIFTPEMHPYMILLRSAAIAARLRYSEFKQGELDPIEEMSLLETVQAYGKLDTAEFIPAEYDDTEELGLDPSEAEGEDNRIFAGSLFKIVKSTNRPISFIQSKIKQYRPHIVLCDSFYRQTAEGSSKSDSDNKVLTSISRQLKDTAADEEIVLLGTHQINRDGSKKVGDLDNLAYSDAFGQDADLVLRVITERKEDAPDISAIALLGAREVNIDGVLINNVPCSDFSEIGKITNINKLLEMLKSETDDEGDEGGSGDGAQKAALKNRTKKTKTKAKAAVQRIKKRKTEDGGGFA